MSTPIVGEGMHTRIDELFLLGRDIWDSFASHGDFADVCLEWLVAIGLQHLPVLTRRGLR